VRRLVRSALLLLLSCLAPAGACALDFAYGGGGSLNFSPVTFSGTYSSTPSQVTSPVSATSLQFFDATYVVVQLGYFLNRGSTEPSAVSTDTAFAAVLTGLSLGISAKLPIRLGPVEVFPIVGAEYVLNLSYTDDKGNDLKAALSGPASSLNELWLKGGLGVDIFLGNLFLRPVVMGGFKPLGAAAVSSTHPTGSITLGLGSYTVDVYVLFGYRF
jgi:hypothetical protein